MQNLVLKSPVRAICALPNDHLCYSTGPFVVILDKEFEIVLFKKVLSSSAAIITGICQLQEPAKLAIWGRRELCILTLSADYTCIASIERHADLAGSWILSCVPVKPNKLVVGLAENGQFAVVEPDSVERISYPIEGNISCFDCNENMLAVGDVFGHVAAFTITGELCWKNAGQLCALRVHSDKIVVGCGSDGSIRVWNDGIMVQKWNGHVNRIWNILSLDCSFVTFGEDAVVRQWSYHNFNAEYEWKFSSAGDILCGASNKLWMFFGCYDGTIKRISKVNGLNSAKKGENFSTCPGELILADNSGTCYNSKGEIVLQSSELRQCLAIERLDDKIYAVCSNGNLLVFANNSHQIIQQNINRLFGSFAYSMSNCSIYDRNRNTSVTLSSRRFLTSFISLCSIFVCGTRCGRILLVDSANGAILKEIQISADAVSSICQMDDFILAACRGGIIYKFALNDTFLELKNSYKTEAHLTRSGVEWIACWNGIILFAYFYDKSFIVKYGFLPLCNFLTLAEWPCGGKHRIWKCNLSENVLSFGYLMHGSVFMNSATLDDCPKNLALGRGRWHSKIVRAAVKLRDSYFITGSDDGSVALWHKNCLVQRLDHIHCSSICCIFCCNGYVFSGGGRSEIVAFQVTGHGELQYKTRFDYCSDTDGLRVVAICATRETTDNIKLIFSLSDGAVLQIIYETLRNEFVCSSIQTFANSKPNCYVVCIVCNEDSVFLAYSNGDIVIHQREKVTLIKRLHKGAITAIYLDEFHLYTGGYDGQFQKLSLKNIDQNNPDPLLVQSFLFPVVGICCLENVVVALTACGTVWRWSESQQAKNIQTPIRDATGILHLGNSFLVFGGNGMQFVESESSIH